MGAVGIIAEYNPFHAGHLRQLRSLGEDPAVVVLSGDYVQRGEPAVFDKFARAEAAVRCGAALVLELPLPWCLSSAEGFARGGVGMLLATGAVDTLSFGSESGDADALNACADALLRPELTELLRQELATGASFAAARERAVFRLAGAAAEPLRRPNDLLAVEYIRQLRLLGGTLKLHPIRREDSVHDGPGSASVLREMMDRRENWLTGIPPEAAAVYEREIHDGKGPVRPEDLRLAMLSRLRERTEEDLARLPDAAEGLEHKLYEAIRNETDPEEMAHAAKSRRYALSRLRRMLMCAALSVERGMADGTPPYLRVLAMDERGMELLRSMRASAHCPVIVKPAAFREMPEETRRIFSLGSDAHDFYVLGRSSSARQRCGEDLRTTPFIIKETEER